MIPMSPRKAKTTMYKTALLMLAFATSVFAQAVDNSSDEQIYKTIVALRDTQVQMRTVLISMGGMVGSLSPVEVEQFMSIMQEAGYLGAIATEAQALGNLAISMHVKIDRDVVLDSLRKETTRAIDGSEGSVGAINMRLAHLKPGPALNEATRMRDLAVTLREQLKQLPHDPPASKGEQ
jgi:hypothetical protein